MFLTATNLFHYLGDVGEVSAADIVGEDFALVEIGRRNRNFKVLRRRAPSLFVKQVPAVISETVSSLAREAACAQLAHEAPAESAMASVLPSLRRYDPGAHILVYEAIEPSETMSEFVAHTGPLSDPMAHAWGATMAACHTQTGRPGALTGIASVLTGAPPWVLDMPDRAEQVMPNLNGGRREIVDAIRRDPILCAGLAAVRAGWRRLCLAHGDLKWDNVLVVGSPERRQELRLIDWELADLGDPLWDVAAGLCSCVQVWLLNQPLAAGPLDTAKPLPQAPLALAGLHPACRAFWAGYREGDGAGFGLGPETEGRLAQLAATRFVLLAFEITPAASAMPAHAALALELARYLFAAPDRALADLFGLTRDDFAAPRPQAASDRSGAPWILERRAA